MNDLASLAELRQKAMDHLSRLPIAMRESISSVWSPLQQDLVQFEVALSRLLRTQSKGAADEAALNVDLQKALEQFNHWISRIISSFVEYGRLLLRQLNRVKILRRVEGAHKPAIKELSDFIDYAHAEVHGKRNSRTLWIQADILVNSLLPQIIDKLTVFRSDFQHHFSAFPLFGSQSRGIIRWAEVFIIVLALLTIFGQIYACTC